jgi:hypothetical protein
MNISAYLVPLGMSYFDGHVNIDSLINDLLVMEDHIKNGANKESNRVRVTLIRTRIQTAIADMKVSVGHDATLISLEYLELLSALVNMENDDPLTERLVSSIQPASTLRQVVSGFEQYKRLLNNRNFGTLYNILKVAVKSNSHIVMMLDIYPPEPSPALPNQNFREQFINQHLGEDVATHISTNEAHQIRINCILDAISDVAKGQPTSLSLGDWKHSEITEGLRRGVFVEHPSSPILVPIIYPDGSEARPFPFDCLSVHNESAVAALSKTRPLRMGLMSGRHPEMDGVVSGYWLQNIEISQHRKTLAHADETAYLRSKERFARMKGNSWNLWFAQTGYPPAVVGFLRALVEELMERTNDEMSLYLVPQYYDWDRKLQQMVYKPGTPWF